MNLNNHFINKKTAHFVFKILAQKMDSILAIIFKAMIKILKANIFNKNKKRLI